MKRDIVAISSIEQGEIFMSKHLWEKLLKDKGLTAIQSSHEILGILEEEFLELKLAIKENNNKNVIQELRDIGAFCTFATTCIADGHTNWGEQTNEI